MNEKKAEADQRDDLAVLIPDQDVTVGGQTFSVNAFRFMEGLKASAIARPILKEMEEFFTRDNAENDDPGLEDLGSIFGNHAEAFMALVSLATGKPVEWLKQLDDMEGELLLLTFWNVNKSFFTRRLVLGAVAKIQAREIARAKEPGSTTGAPLPAH